MKQIVITLTVPDDVEVHVAPTPAQNGPQAAAAPQVAPGATCPKHGAEKVKPSRFGGVYCTAADPSEEKGYCAWKQK